MPTVHWEYLIQAAEYARVFSVLAPKGYLVGVEDRLMDITVSDDSRELLWYIEVKESAVGLVRFAEEIRRLGQDGFDPDASDRGRDGLRKAKYLMRYKPTYFSLSATGMRLDFAVDYQDDGTFEMRPDVVPLA